MRIGKIIKSNSHLDYICQIYGASEITFPLSRDDYAFGTFVQMELDNRRTLVGIIYDTQLFNPDFGRLGPRLSPEPELAIFSPDYLNEKVTLVGIVAVGMIDANRHVKQGVPPLSANSDAMVEKMSDEQIRNFHQSNPTLKLAYVPLLLKTPLPFDLVRSVLSHLMTLFPQKAALLSVFRADLAWKSQIQPLGGR
jgi:hypothetical protein